MASKKPMKDHIHAKGTDIAVVSSGDENDYISLTDIARYKSDAPDDVIKNWMRNRDTIEFLGLWEQLNNPEFKPVEFDGFRIQAGSNTFTMSPKKWVDATSAIGIFSKAGRYGGTFAHRDIAFEFASWISAEFKLYIIKDYQRLKADAGGSWRSTASPARATPPGSSATTTTRNTTCSLGWTGPTSAACTASAAATSTTRCPC